ncbi:peptide/nickel transport system permease protein [Paenibacillus endophyticus]|uniref:Peptide/nickel transport system permease protein n=1 Tax=Paenibacillus endophyticus TaxID=1294268 RepID=A0A7W5C8L7_9BACL|nr:ABC transporter permease [Paenibacillus endophyticus]MBB3153121.1 peptide/nickel transport system permease protein [Paenibacillus endophyticus]
MLRGIAVFTGKKIIRLFLLLATVSMITFALVAMSPIDPVQSYIGADVMRVGAEQREEIAAYWGLDKPFAERFMKWAGALIQGDMGTSMIYREAVTKVIGERFMHSVWLMAFAWTLSGIIGFTVGAAAALRKGSWLDRVITGFCYTLASTPAFWVGLLLMMIVAVWLGLLPVGLGVPAGMLAGSVTFFDYIRHMILPGITLSIVGIAPIALHTRQKLIEVMDSDFILFARARGERGARLFFRHALRNIALPAITLQFASFGELFGGAVLAEQVFSYPGLGQATVEAGLRGDVPLLMGLVLCSTLFVFTGNTLADYFYHIVDPRLRLEKGARR